MRVDPGNVKDLLLTMFAKCLILEKNVEDMHDVCMILLGGQADAFFLDIDCGKKKYEDDSLEDLFTFKGATNTRNVMS